MDPPPPVPGPPLLAFCCDPAVANKLLCVADMLQPGGELPTKLLSCWSMSVAVESGSTEGEEEKVKDQERRFLN